MQRSIRKSALLGFATVLISGCATQQEATPEYRLSSSAPVVVPGASMLQRGRAQLDAGLDALAIEAFRAEIRINPESADAYNGLAVAYGRIGRDDLAQRYFETALAKDPGNGKAQANLARLTGDAATPVQLVDVGIRADAGEPVAVAVAMQEDRIGQILDGIEMPVLASSMITPSPNESPVPAGYALAKHGVLSTRFAAAPARFATAAVSANSLRPRKPAEPPTSPAPTLPPANLPLEYRSAGNRLVRVSLGEVHLITRSDPPAKSARRQPEFRSFGDRLALWLPESIAAEQVRPMKGRAESTILLAAIARAEQNKEFASADKAALPELGEFAYLSFDAGEDAAKV